MPRERDGKSGSQALIQVQSLQESLTEIASVLVIPDHVIAFRPCDGLGCASK
jgi:hypothetical protein